HRRHGDTWGAAASHFLLAHAAADDQDYETAKALWEESRRLFDRAADPLGTLLAKRMLAWSYDELGESDRARRLKEDVLEQARAAGVKHVQVHALEALAHAAAPQGQFDLARSLLTEAYELNSELGDRFREAVIVCRFARLLAFSGRVEAAARVLAAGETLYAEMGAKPMGWLRRGNGEALSLIRAQLDEAGLAEAYESGRTLSADDAVALALDEFR